VLCINDLFGIYPALLEAVASASFCGVVEVRICPPYSTAGL